MNYNELAAVAEATGFTNWGTLDIATIELKPEVRDMCAACHLYGKRWSCPPGCGTLEECGEKISQYSFGILVQSVGDIEDGFDFEAMQEIEAEHKQRLSRMYAALREANVDVLALGAGGCRLCKECTYPDAPCRFPEKMFSSMEANGILVLEVCKKNNLQYYYGSEKMAYTSCFLVR